MAECLLTTTEAAERFGISRRQFDRHRAEIIARWGLQEVPAGNRRMFREASIDKVIFQAAETGRPLFENGH